MLGKTAGVRFAAPAALLLVASVLAAAGSPPWDCGAPNTLPGAWDDGNCLRGAHAEVWARDAKNRATGGDAARCAAGTGAFSCEAHRAVWNAPHVFLTPPTRPRKSNASPPSLAVFLPGTGATPSVYSRVLASAQQAGHFVVGLAHLSQPVPVSAFNAWCASADLEPRTEASCNSRAHRAMVMGLAAAASDDQGLWDVGHANSVEATLRAALESVEWGAQFFKLYRRSNNSISDSDLLWERIIVSGHSQGAGHAAWWSVGRPVLGAVLLSGPQDTAAAATGWLRDSSENSTLNATRRRILLSAHEECGPYPRDPISFCEANLLMRNAATMRMLPARNWTCTGGLVGSGGGVVVSYAEPAAGCIHGRRYHCSTACDPCAPQGMDALWRDLFSNFPPPQARSTSSEL